MMRQQAFLPIFHCYVLNYSPYARRSNKIKSIP
jgi:hypothetical protein